MGKFSYYSLVLLVFLCKDVLTSDVNTDAAFAVLEERIRFMEMQTSELTASVETQLETFNTQINDIAEEFNDMSERMSAIFDGFTEDGLKLMNENGGVVDQISALVQQEFSEQKQAMREFVNEYEKQIESLGRYVSDSINVANITEDLEGDIRNTIPIPEDSSNACKMCMLVATTTEKKSRRLEQRLADLTKVTAERAEEYATLQNDMGETMVKVQELVNDDAYQADSLDNITSEVDALKTFVDSLNEKHERKIGFTARLTDSLYVYPGNTLLPFNEVKYNYGEGYDPQTGIFTAPKSGTYLLSFNVQSTQQREAHVCLIVGGTLRLTAVAGRGHRITGGNTGIVFMEEGEQAWVRTTTLKPRFGI